MYLPHSATIERDADPGLRSNWITRHDSLPCRFGQFDGARVGNSRAIPVILYTPRGSVIAVSDRVREIRNLRGNRIAGVILITAIRETPYHIEVRGTMARGGTGDGPPVSVRAHAISGSPWATAYVAAIRRVSGFAFTGSPYASARVSPSQGLVATARSGRPYAEAFVPTVSAHHVILSATGVVRNGTRVVLDLRHN